MRQHSDRSRFWKNLFDKFWLQLKLVPPLRRPSGWM
jgi:hypothetical protein